MKTTYSMTGIVLVAVSGLLAACGEATPEPAQPAVTATAAVTAAPTATAMVSATPTQTPTATPAPAPLPDLGLKLGKLDSKLAAQALSAKGAEKFKIAVSPSGEILKLSLYHNDASLIPEPVMATLKKKLPGATIKSFESEIYSDKGRVFEIEVTTKDKKDCEIGAMADGKYLYTECDMKADKLPKAVKDAVAKAVPGGEIVEAEKKDGDTNDFSVESKANGVMHYLHIDTKGKVTWHAQRVAGLIDIQVGGNAPGAGDAKPGNFDPELFQASLKAKGVEKIKVMTDASGTVGKISLYHKDDSAVPDAAKAAAAAKFPGSKAGYYESEVYSNHGKVFESDLTLADSKKCEFAALKDGTHLYTECDIKKDELPKEVADAVGKLVAGGEIVETERKDSPWGNGYNVEAKAAGMLHYIKLSPTGEVTWHGVRVPAEIDVTLP
ncbi:MAG: hypothetical protein U0359_03240 [Byssovorax sp.]